MKFGKLLSIIMAVVLCATLFSGCGEGNKSDVVTTTTTKTTVAEKTIALVSLNDNTGFYESLKRGAEDATKKYGFSLEYIGLEETEQSDARDIIKHLKGALDSGASGVAFTPVGEGYSDILSRFYEAKIPVVQVDSIVDGDIEILEGRNKNPIISTVLTDFDEAGSVCAEKMFEAVKDDIKSSQNTFVIGVIEREDEDSDKVKSGGFVEKFSELADADESTKDKYRLETADGTDGLEELMRENVKAVFMTHPDLADKISDTVFSDKKKYKGLTFCGFDSGAKQLKWLESDESGRFIGGVAQDAYNLGYNAVEQCIFSVQNKEIKPEIKIKAHWYDRENVDKLKQDNLVFVK